MFGLKLFTKTKTKRFTSDNERKQYYAIQGYYKKKNEVVKKSETKPKNNKSS